MAALGEIARAACNKRPSRSELARVGGTLGQFQTGSQAGIGIARSRARALRRVARDNTVKFQCHTLQLLPDRQRRSYAGAAVVVLHGLDGRLSLQHEGRIIAAQEAPPSPGSLRNGSKPSSGDASQSPDPKGLSQPRETAPDPLTMVAAANGHGSVIDDADVVSMTVTTSPRRSTFLQQARWDAVQKTKLEGMLSRVNYICRLASISFAGSPPWPGPVAGQRWSGSWGRQTRG